MIQQKPTATDYKGPYFDGILKSNMGGMKEEMKKDDDKVIIIDGRERIGKSVFAQQMGWFMSDGKLELKDICLTAKEFQKRVKECPHGATIIFDECYLGMASADAMKSYNRMLLKMLVTCGQKNLCLILVLPSVFDISKYVALHRADALIHIYKSKGERGFFAYYSAPKLKSMYIVGKKFYSYGKMKPNFYGRFYNHYTVDETEYRKKKAESLRQLLSDKEEAVGIAVSASRLYRSLQLLREHTKLNAKEIAKLVGCSDKTVYRAWRWCQLNPQTQMTSNINNTLQSDQK